MIFFYILGVIVIITFIVLWIIYLIKIYKEQAEPVDGTIFENYQPQFAGGHTDLIIDDKIEKGDRVCIIAYPRDLYYARLFKKKEKIEIKPYKLFFLKSHFEFFPRNSFSEHRNKAKGYPPTQEDIPEGLKSTHIGRIVMERIKELNVGKHENNILREEIESIKAIDKTDYSKQRLLEFLQDMIDANKTQVQSISREERPPSPPVGRGDKK